MNDEHIRITIGDAGWTFWDWVKVTLTASVALTLIVLLPLVPTLIAS